MGQNLHENMEGFHRAGHIYAYNIYLQTTKGIIMYFKNVTVCKNRPCLENRIQTLYLENTEHQPIYRLTLIILVIVAPKM